MYASASDISCHAISGFAAGSHSPADPNRDEIAFRVPYPLPVANAILDLLPATATAADVTSGFPSVAIARDDQHLSAGAIGFGGTD